MAPSGAVRSPSRPGYGVTLHCRFRGISSSIVQTSFYASPCQRHRRAFSRSTFFQPPDTGKFHRTDHSDLRSFAISTVQHGLSITRPLGLSPSWEKTLLGITQEKVMFKFIPIFVFWMISLLVAPQAACATEVIGAQAPTVRAIGDLQIKPVGYVIKKVERLRVPTVCRVGECQRGDSNFGIGSASGRSIHIQQLRTAYSQEFRN